MLLWSGFALVPAELASLFICCSSNNWCSQLTFGSLSVYGFFLFFYFFGRRVQGWTYFRKKMHPLKTNKSEDESFDFFFLFWDHQFCCFFIYPLFDNREIRVVCVFFSFCSFHALIFFDLLSEIFEDIWKKQWRANDQTMLLFVSKKC